MPPRQGELVVGSGGRVIDISPVASALLAGAIDTGSHLVDVAGAVVDPERPLVAAALVLLGATPAMGGARRITVTGGGVVVLEVEPVAGGARRLRVREADDPASPDHDAAWWAASVTGLTGPVAVLGDDGTVLAASAGLAEVSGRAVSDIVGRTPSWLTAADDAPLAAALQAVLQGGLLETARCSLRLTRPDGSEVTVLDHRRHVAGGVVLSYGPAPVGLPPLVDALGAAVLVTDADHRVVAANPEARRLTGLPPEGATGVPLPAAVTADDPGGLDDLLDRAARDGRADGEIGITDPAGESRVYAWTATLYGQGTVVTGVDVTGRHRHTVELAHRALHDPLTGLPNRALLLERLVHALDRLDRIDGDVAVLFLDLNRFKEVNDSFGHDAGDRLLAGLAERLRSVLRPADTVARYGGDEFVVVCEEITGAGEVAEIIGRVVAAVERPFQVAGREASVSVSVGAATARTAGRDVDALLREADAAMYRVKTKGQAARVIDAEQGVRPEDLRRGIDAGELTVRYQPVIDLRHGGTVAVEALVRWQHPRRGLLAPHVFLPVAEATGLVVPLGAAVLRQACADAAGWAAASRRLGVDPVPVSVNLSVRELGDDKLVDTVAAALEHATLEPGLLRVEVAEHTFVRDPAIAVPALRRLSALGVAVVVDDAGLGMPSTAVLRELQLAELKVEGSAVRRLPSGDDRSRRAVEEVAELGRVLDLRTVAEGVETEAQLDAVGALGFDRAQGHVFAPPQPADVVHELLAAGVRWPVFPDR